MNYFELLQLVYYNMNKCQHGQKITIFCASDCCVWKQAAGCDICIKKYHNHMGPTIFLTEEQIIALVKKYTMDSSIKPKCRLLQEAIYSYFNLIKNQITSSIDTVCKNIINQIGYPYLYSNNTLSTYKRLKNKEYKKLVQKQFKNLYELSQKINEKDLTKQESKIYIEEMKHTEGLLNGIQEIIKKYESIIKNSYPAFSHDNSYISKINQILKTLNMESPRRASKAKQLRERQLIKPQMATSLVKQKQQSKLKPLQLKKATSEQTPSPAQSRTPMINISPPVVTRPNYSRDVSIDRKIVRQHKFSNAAALKTQKEKQKDSSLKDVKQPNIEKVEPVKQQANIREIEISEKKKLLIDMMKQKEDSLKKSNNQIEKKEQVKYKVQVEAPSYFKRQLSERSAYKEHQTSQSQKYQEFDVNLKTLNDESEQNSNNQLQMIDSATKSQERDVGNHAFTQLPLIQNDSRKSSDMQQVKEKVFFVPKTKELEQFNSNYDQTQSPIFKNFNKSTVFKPKQKQAKQVQQQKAQQKQEQLLKKKAVFSKHSQILELNQNQEKSLALLLKSLALNAEQAIKYLQSALDQAENNLSAAEYLTYVYLEQDKPHDCLLLCNKMLEKLVNSNQPQQLSLIINNNKAAALNILGRYSQSIMIIQKCLRYRQKDYFYKNLGDAYFSISIYEKAIYNYQKCLKINECYDEAQYNLAVCLYIQENYFNAKLAIKKALQMQPQNQAYLQLLFNIETRITHC